jgi:hypothetical protein
LANIIRWTAPDALQMESAVTGYIAQGFVVANRTPTSVTVVKRKQFSIVALVIGLILCVVPLLIYLVYYLTLTDQLIEITLAQVGQLSPDGHWSWNGSTWMPVAGHTSGTGGLLPAAGDNPATEPA